MTEPTKLWTSAYKEGQREERARFRRAVELAAMAADLPPQGVALLRRRLADGDAPYEILGSLVHMCQAVERARYQALHDASADSYAGAESSRCAAVGRGGRYV